MNRLHEATQLGLQIWMYLGGIALVLWFINKLVKANTVIEGAKNIPGGMNYVEPPKADPVQLTPEEEEAFEELSWRAHA